MRRLSIIGLVACLAFGWGLQGLGAGSSAAWAAMPMPAGVDGCNDAPATGPGCMATPCALCAVILPAAAILPAIEVAAGHARAERSGSGFMPRTPTPIPRRPLRI